MDRRILDMTCTLWAKGPETARVASWSKVSFPCHWEPRRGSYRSVNGEESAYNLEMICNHTGISKGDKLTLGTSDGTVPPDGAYTVVYVDSLPLRGKVHHYEVYAQ